MRRVYENTVISQVEREGMPGYADEEICPICGKNADEYCENLYGEIVGCRECVRFRPVWEYDEEEV